MLVPDAQSGAAGGNEGNVSRERPGGDLGVGDLTDYLAVAADGLAVEEGQHQLPTTQMFILLGQQNRTLAEDRIGLTGVQDIGIGGNDGLHIAGVGDVDHCLRLTPRQ